MKSFYVQTSIGKAKYVCSYHNEGENNPDGSDFYDVAIFSNKKKLKHFIKKLTINGYIEK